jgi:glycosyltransferase involved in cell wall biosynthesis
MTADRPLVTALINTYNYGRYLPFAINSVLNQTYPNIEIVVVDDGSTDYTPDVLAQYADKVRAIRTENGGQGHSFNIGIPQARGELVMMLDADDVWLPDKVERMVELAAMRPKAGMLYHRFQNIDANGKIQDFVFPPATVNGDYRERYLRAGAHWWCPITSVLTFRTDHIRRVLPIPSYAVREGADTVITDFCAMTTEIASRSDVLSLRRLHGTNHYATGREVWYRSEEIREGDVRRIEWRLFSMRQIMKRVGIEFQPDMDRNEWRTTNLFWLGRAPLWKLLRNCLLNSEHDIRSRWKRIQWVLDCNRQYREERTRRARELRSAQ